MTFSRRALPAIAAGATLLLAGACNSSGGGPGAAGAPSAAVATTTSAAVAGNTAAVCKSGGEAARTVVIDLFTKMATLAERDTPPGEAELTKIYQTTFSSLRNTLTKESGRATDPELAAVLAEIATEADKIATAGDPEAVGTGGFEAALKKLETHCPSGTPGASTAPGAATAAGTVGGKGSACTLPVSFAVPEKWKLSAVDNGGDDALAELTRRGSLRMACEANARPAGLTGFLRVWVGPEGDARAALTTLQKGQKTRNAAYSPVKLGDRDGVELKYQLFSELLEEYSERRAFAVAAPGGTVVVELSGLEQADPVMLTAYEQAKSTLKVNP